VNSTKVAIVAVVMVLLAGAAFSIRGIADETAIPQAGQVAPDFTLPSQDGSNISLDSFRGKWVVLYFYPKDMTTGCTIEAHNFQRDMDKYNALNAVVLGVSLDTVESHRTWCAKDTFSFKLLADPDHKVVDEYGVPLKGAGPIKVASRQTFLISPAGKVVKYWPDVKPDHHSEEVLAELQTEKK
jgi:thioredoxin-dependent peroxiredoxin